MLVVDDDNTDHIVSVQLDGVESMAQFLDSHNPDDVCCQFPSLKTYIIITSTTRLRCVIVPARTTVVRMRVFCENITSL